MVGVDPDYPVNVAWGDGTHHAEGLNLVVGSGSSNAVTGYVDSSGKFGAAYLDTSQPADRLRVAIRLYGSSFSEDKVASLAILRHGLVHAHYHDLALSALRSWQGQGSKGSFDAWLNQQKDLTDVDRQLIKDDEPIQVKDEMMFKTANTELLGYLEGFMTGFVLTDPQAPNPKLWEELLGALSGSNTQGWANASTEVREEAKLRLKRFYCDALDEKHRNAFDAWVDAESQRVNADRLASGGKHASGKKAAADQQEKLEDFVTYLLYLRGCKTHARWPRR